MADAELKPCPFCGGAVELERTTGSYEKMHGQREWWGVVCRNTINVGGTCAIQQVPSASKEAAVERWNCRATHPTEAGAPTASAELTPLDYRAQGREEVLAIILAESSESPFSDCIGWAQSGAPDDEGGTYWQEDKLRAKLHIGDSTHDAYGRAEAAYWEALGRSDEAKREMLLAEQAPFYKPLHDFLSKHEAWDLMADLKREQAARESAAPGAEQDAKDAAPDGWIAIASIRGEPTSVAFRDEDTALATCSDGQPIPFWTKAQCSNDTALMAARAWIVKNRPALTLSRQATIDEYMELLGKIDAAIQKGAQ